MNMNKMIDHTLLKADAVREEIVQLCAEAVSYDFASVCVNPTWVREASNRLKGSDVKVCTVIGFPLGAGTTATKVFEAKNAIENGAQEVDMVINIGALKDDDEQLVEKEIQAVVDTVAKKALVKVIIETSLLTQKEKITAAKIVKKVGAAFIKTSTGFSTGGATVEDVALLKKIVGENIGVKASGGVRDAATAAKMVKSGADRIGTSSGAAIIEGTKS